MCDPESTMVEMCTEEKEKNRVLQKRVVEQSGQITFRAKNEAFMHKRIQKLLKRVKKLEEKLIGIEGDGWYEHQRVEALETQIKAAKEALCDGGDSVAFIKCMKAFDILSPADEPAELKRDGTDCRPCKHFPEGECFLVRGGQVSLSPTFNACPDFAAAPEQAAWRIRKPEQAKPEDDLFLRGTVPIEQAKPERVEQPSPEEEYFQRMQEFDDTHLMP